MPRLNHANLPVADVAALRDFFVRHFGFRVVLTRGQDGFVVLEGDGGFVLNLMRHRPREGAGYPDGFHVGFFLDAPADVRAKHAELAAAAVDVGEVGDVVRGGWASTTFYCRAPNGLLVEVSSPRDGEPAAGGGAVGGAAGGAAGAAAGAPGAYSASTAAAR